jgi:predicted DNA-binding protein
MTDKIVWVGGQVPAQLSERLKRVADQNERSMAAELRVAVRAHVEAHENEEKAA